jgi:hypothetical protein
MKYIGKNILNHDLIVRRGDISGSAASTGSFGSVEATTFKGDGGGLTGVTADTANIAVKEEGSSLTSQVSSFDFVGSSVTATTSGNAVTVTATSASPFSQTGSYYAANSDIQVTGSFAVSGIISEQGYSIPELMEKMVVDQGSTTFLNFVTITNESGEVIVA